VSTSLEIQEDAIIESIEILPQYFVAIKEGKGERLVGIVRNHAVAEASRAVNV
jgi:hypothetical protein